MKKVNIPEGVTDIEGGAFSDCDIKNITMPVSIRHIGSQVFDGCSGLKEIYYSGSRQEWAGIEINYKQQNVLNSIILYCGKADKTSTSGGAEPRITYKMYRMDDAVIGNEKYALEHQGGRVNYQGNSVTVECGEYEFDQGLVLYVKSSGNQKVFYETKDTKVLSVSSLGGRIRFKSCGVAYITVKAPARGKYQAAVKKIKVIVVPGQVVYESTTDQKNKAISIEWKPVLHADGYEFSFSMNEDFSNDIKKDVGQKTSVKISNIQLHSKVNVRIRTYIKAGKRKYYGFWRERPGLYPEERR